MARLRRLFLLVLMLAFEAGVVLFPGSAYAFAGNLESVGLTVAGGVARYAGEARFVNSVAKTVAISKAAASSLVVEGAFTMAATAGRAVAGACFANILVCGGAIGIATWMASSQIRQSGDIYIVDGMIEKTGLHYTGKFTYPANQGGQVINAAAINRSGVVDIIAGHMCTASTSNGPCVRTSWVIYNTASNIARWNGTTSSADASVTIYKTNSSGTEYVYAVQLVTTIPDTGTWYDIETRPATQEDMDKHADTVPVPDDAANEAQDRGIPIPVTVGVGPDGTGQFVPQGSTYPCTKYASGVCQDGTVVKPDPTTSPTATTNEPVTRDPTSTTDPTDPDDPTDTPEKEDQCKLYPDSVGCTKMGEDPGDEVAKKTVTVSYAAEWLGLPAGCPPPIVVNGNQISYQSACDAMNQIRPFVVALAAVAAMLTALAIVRSSS